MRCKACNSELTDAEATAQDEHGFIDLCVECLKSIAEAEEIPLEPDTSVGYRDRSEPLYHLDG